MDSIRSGVTIRNPSTANLMVSSLDRTSGKSTDFTISKKQNILSGFFTRMGMVEISLDWCVPNISEYLKNRSLVVEIGSNPAFTASVPQGHYTVQSLLDALVVALNTNTYSAVFSVGGVTNLKSLVCTTNFNILEGNLQQSLNLATDEEAIGFPIFCPNLLPYPFIDFVCSNLTYQQGLKDATTSESSRDVLYRWVFGWDECAPMDSYGYAINQGYLPFIARRYLSYPKQIKWDSQQPIGQLKFEVYDANGLIVQVADPIAAGGSDGEMEFFLTLLVSEQ